MVILTICAATLLVGVLALIPLGLRAGDRLGDARLLETEPSAAPRGARVTLTNPGSAPVLVGLSIRAAGWRLRLEGDGYVQIRTRSTTASSACPRRR